MLHAADLHDAAAAMARGLSGVYERTNRISAAHIHAATAGVGAKVFHDLLHAILTGRFNSNRFIDRIEKIDHTSGWGAVLGIGLASEWVMISGETPSAWKEK